MLRPKMAVVADLSTSGFDLIIDVRTPDEYELDHLPGAVNYPVLDNEQRIQIGTLHNHSPFEARRLGAALISSSVSRILTDELSTHQKSWKPLIYCWRGGLRSGSLAMVMAQVGWPVHQLTNGYKAYRQMVIDQSLLLIDKCTFRIVSAPTGSGKTHFLYAIQRAGGQIIDLEGLACHRGSVLGRIPGQKQPSQRLFESKLLEVLQKIDFSRDIFIESEGSKVGNICVPMALRKRLQGAQCIFINVAVEERVRFLCQEYSFFIEDPESLIQNLSYLSELRSKETLQKWIRLVHEGEFTDLVTELIEQHYDPCYQKSLRRHYPQVDNSDTVHVTALSLSEAALDILALTML